MPDRLMIEAATPTCPKPAAALASASGRTLCGQLLRWDDARLLWRCTIHGEVWAGAELGRRQATMRYA